MQLLLSSIVESEHVKDDTKESGQSFCPLLLLLFILVQMTSDPEESSLDPASIKEPSLDPVSTEEPTTIVEDNGNVN